MASNKLSFSTCLYSYACIYHIPYYMYKSLYLLYEICCLFSNSDNKILQLYKMHGIPLNKKVFVGYHLY